LQDGHPYPPAEGAVEGAAEEEEGAMARDEEACTAAP